MKKIILLFLIILGLPILNSCTDDPLITPEGFTVWIIKKGKYQPALSLSDMKVKSYSDSIVWAIRPDTSLCCHYGKSFVSKYIRWKEDLAGNNSIALGFRSDSDGLEFVAYYHNNGQKNWFVSPTIIRYSYHDILNLLSQENFKLKGIEVTIIFNPKTYEVNMAGGKKAIVPRTSGYPPNCTKYQEYPFLGGDSVWAQKDLYFYTKRIKGG